jgi:hypothetical protein
MFNIAKTATHGMNFINSGVNKVTLFKAAAHGVARGAIQSAQGGSFKAGFLSGFSSAVDVGTSGYGGVVGRTTIMGIVGGTASALGGGKFSNGAMSGAFTHMFNAEGVAKRLTFAKAREHYVENSSKQISVLASSVDLSKVKVSDFKYIGHKRPVQLFFHGDEYSNFNDALTYGGITLVYAGGNQVGIIPDYYNFDMKDWSLSTSVRNLGTIGGRILNMDPMGTASGYTINFVGTATIGGN